MSNLKAFPTGGLYLLLFFLYLFGPLAVMVVTAFNSSSFPRISPWECLTSDWFFKLFEDETLIAGLGNSFVIGIGVVLVAVPVGLAAAIVLSQVGPHLRSVMYAVFIAPILMPGVVIGLSTLIFWDRLGTFFGAAYDSFFYSGMFLTIAGQVTFISAYSMLVFLSRLQRFDPTLTEAALDMGASQTQAFVKILLPFMTPAILSASVLAFLASMENYNTTVFTIVAESTFTTVLAQKVRYGLDPSISAVAVIIVGITLVGAIIFENYNRLRTPKEARAATSVVPPIARFATNPLVIIGFVLVCVVGFVTWVGTHDSSVCEANVEQLKREYQQEQLEQQRNRAPAPASEPAAPAPPPANTGGGVFAPGNLSPGQPEADEAPASPFGNVFTPENLQGGN